MATKKTIKELITKISISKPITPWSEVEEYDTFHIPPIGKLDRCDIIIVEKKDDVVDYVKLNTKDKNIKSFHKDSVFAKVIVRKKSF